MMAIAAHEPEKLYQRNKAALSMTKAQLSDFASTKEKGLPRKKRKKRKTVGGQARQMLNR